MDSSSLVTEDEVETKPHVAIDTKACTCSVISDQGSGSNDADSIHSGESLLKTFTFNPNENSVEMEKCMEFWKNILEKNLKPVKCIVSPIKNDEAKKKKNASKQSLLKEQQTQIWLDALNEIQKRHLCKKYKMKRHKVDYCQICENIESKNAFLEPNLTNDILELNNWQPKSTKRPKKANFSPASSIFEVIYSAKNTSRPSTAKKQSASIGSPSSEVEVNAEKRTCKCGCQLPDCICAAAAVACPCPTCSSTCVCELPEPAMCRCGCQLPACTCEEFADAGAEPCECSCSLPACHCEYRDGVEEKGVQASAEALCCACGCCVGACICREVDAAAVCDECAECHKAGGECRCSASEDNASESEIVPAAEVETAASRKASKIAAEEAPIAKEAQSPSSRRLTTQSTGGPSQQATILANRPGQHYCTICGRYDCYCFQKENAPENK